MDSYVLERANNKWLVLETATTQKIREFDSKEDAIRYRKFLKSGGAFNGTTPEFILKSVKEISENLDDALASVLK
jgi:hypothetical protein